MITAEICEGQRWQATGAGDVVIVVIDIVRAIDEWLWLVRTELGCMVEMADSYIAGNYRLISPGEIPLG